jgi:hypothetical protein
MGVLATNDSLSAGAAPLAGGAEAGPPVTEPSPGAEGTGWDTAFFTGWSLGGGVEKRKLKRIQSPTQAMTDTPTGTARCCSFVRRILGRGRSPWPGAVNPQCLRTIGTPNPIATPKINAKNAFHMTAGPRLYPPQNIRFAPALRQDSGNCNTFRPLYASITKMAPISVPYRVVLAQVLVLVWE